MILNVGRAAQIYELLRQKSLYSVWIPRNIKIRYQTVYAGYHGYFKQPQEIGDNQWRLARVIN
jgi:hypothetical protein